MDDLYKSLCHGYFLEALADGLACNCYLQQKLQSGQTATYV